MGVESTGLTDPLHRGDGLAVHADHRGQAGVHTEVVEAGRGAVQSGDHHSAGPTPALPTPQLGPT